MKSIAMLNYQIASPKVAAKGWMCGIDDISYDPCFGMLNAPFCAEGPQTFHKKMCDGVVRASTGSSTVQYDWPIRDFSGSSHILVPGIFMAFASG